MSAPVFIGDEVSAAGWRLAGVRVIIPEPGQEALAVTRVLDDTKSELALLAAPCARLLPALLLERFLTSVTPLTLVVPDARGLAQPPDLAARVRGRLGMNP
ncbi:MAG: Vacuolar H+transporting two-sector ATPase F subunit [Magnetococcales bacterium]|nr:Vacuolar H+transporting two-sector ATPase F subunit [Magnetococcales bacterium]